MVYVMCDVCDTHQAHGTQKHPVLLGWKMTQAGYLHGGWSSSIWHELAVATPWVVGGGDPDEAGKPGLGQGCANPQASCSAAIGSSRKLGMASPPPAACS